MESAGSASAVQEQALRFLGVIIPNPEIEIYDYALSSHSRASRKTIIEPCGSNFTQSP